MQEEDGKEEKRKQLQEHVYFIVYTRLVSQEKYTLTRT